MARSKTRNRTSDRDHSPVASGSPLALTTPSGHYLALLGELEDRRQFHPDGPGRSARNLSGGFAQVTVSSPRTSKKNLSVTSKKMQRFAFAAPREVVVCVRRKERREVLFALRKRRSGRGGKKRRNFFSDIRC